MAVPSPTDDLVRIEAMVNFLSSRSAMLEASVSLPAPVWFPESTIDGHPEHAELARPPAGNAVGRLFPIGAVGLPPSDASV